MRRGGGLFFGRLPGPAWSWAAGFVACAAADAALGRWVVLLVFVVGFYGGVVAIELATYPLLGRWRAQLRRHGPRAWYLAVIGGLWAGPALMLASSSLFGSLGVGKGERPSG